MALWRTAVVRSLLPCAWLATRCPGVVLRPAGGALPWTGDATHLARNVAP